MDLRIHDWVFADFVLKFASVWWSCFTVFGRRFERMKLLLSFKLFCCCTLVLYQFWDYYYQPMRLHHLYCQFGEVIVMFVGVYEWTIKCSCCRFLNLICCIWNAFYLVENSCMKMGNVFLSSYFRFVTSHVV